MADPKEGDTYISGWQSVVSSSSYREVAPHVILATPFIFGKIHFLIEP
jgi:hypothetical protein